MANKKINSNIEDAKNYYRSMTEYVERLRILHSSLRRRIKYADRLFKFWWKSFSHSFASFLLSFHPFFDWNSFALQHKSMSFRDEVQRLLTEASDKEAIGIAILVTVLIVSPIIIILVRNVVATIQVSGIRAAKPTRTWLMMTECKLLFNPISSSIRWISRKKPRN